MDGAPSRVLHIRKLPGEVTETEVIALGLPFGKVTNILMLKGKNQVICCFSFLWYAYCLTSKCAVQMLLKRSHVTVSIKKKKKPLLL